MTNGRTETLEVIGLSLALAGALLALTAGVLAAAGAWWAPLGLDGGGVVQLAIADTNPATLYARTGDSQSFVLPLGIACLGYLEEQRCRRQSWQPTALGVSMASGDSNVSLTAMAIDADGSTVCAAQNMLRTPRTAAHQHAYLV